MRPTAAAAGDEAARRCDMGGKAVQFLAHIGLAREHGGFLRRRSSLSGVNPCSSSANWRSTFWRMARGCAPALAAAAVHSRSISARCARISVASRAPSWRRISPRLSMALPSPCCSASVRRAASVSSIFGSSISRTPFNPSRPSSRAGLGRNLRADLVHDGENLVERRAVDGEPTLGRGIVDGQRHGDVAALQRFRGAGAHEAVEMLVAGGKPAAQIEIASVTLFNSQVSRNRPPRPRCARSPSCWRSTT